MKAVEGRLKWYFSSIVTYQVLTLLYNPAVSLVLFYWNLCYGVMRGGFREVSKKELFNAFSWGLHSRLGKMIKFGLIIVWIKSCWREFWGIIQLRHTLNIFLIFVPEHTNYKTPHSWNLHRTFYSSQAYINRWFNVMIRQSIAAMLLASRRGFLKCRQKTPTYCKASWSAAACLPLEGEWVVSSRLVNLSLGLIPPQSKVEPFEFHGYAKWLGWKVWGEEAFS